MPKSPVILHSPKRFADERGWFSEVYSVQAWLHLGITSRFVQDNQSLSLKPFTIRGAHFQTPPHGQDKLVRCIRGRIYDVAIDIRNGSPTFGQWVGAELSAENGNQLFVPVGFAHAFLTLEPDCEIHYKVSDIYAPHCDAGIRWDSAGIEWNIPAGVTPTLSTKDAALPPLSSFNSPFAYDGCPLAPLG